MYKIAPFRSRSVPPVSVQPLCSPSLRKEAFRLKVALLPTLFSASLQKVRQQLCCLRGTYALNRFKRCLINQLCKISFVSAPNDDLSSLKDPSSSKIKIVILSLIFPLIPRHPFSGAGKTCHLGCSMRLLPVRLSCSYALRSVHFVRTSLHSLHLIAASLVHLTSFSALW